MVLAQYTDKFWYPSGALATGVLVRVFPLISNILAPLFANQAGTIPLTNPLTTDATGSISFFAEEGEYWLHADSESFRISVGTPPLDVREVASATISTGIVAGGDLSVNGLNPAAIDIAPMVGYITSFSTDPFNPTITRVTYPGGTVALDAAGLTRTATWWLMDAAQNIIQQGTPPTNTQTRQLIFLGVTAQEAGVIFVDQSLPVILQQPANQLADLMNALGPFSISGNQITPNGANLMINHAAGQLFARAFNHFMGPVQTDDPHVSTTFAQTPAQFRYINRSSLMFGPLRNTLDVANYDNAGVITPIGGGANASTVHRLWLFATNTPEAQLAFQYGQTVYPSLAAAAASVHSGSYITNPLITGNGAMVSQIAVTRTATNLSDTSQATFIHASKLETP